MLLCIIDFIICCIVCTYHSIIKSINKRCFICFCHMSKDSLTFTSYEGSYWGINIVAYFHKAHKYFNLFMCFVLTSNKFIVYSMCTQVLCFKGYFILEFNILVSLSPIVICSIVIISLNVTDIIAAVHDFLNFLGKYLIQFFKLLYFFANLIAF